MGDSAVIDNSSITEGCQIYGTVKNSVLGAGVKVLEGATVIDSVIMENVTVGEGSLVQYSIVDENVTVGKNCVIGADRSTAEGISVRAAGLNLKDGIKIGDGEMISTAADLKAKEEA